MKARLNMKVRVLLVLVIFSCSICRIQEPVDAQQATSTLTYVAEVVQGAAHFVFPSTPSNKLHPCRLQMSRGCVRADAGTKVECVSSNTKVIIWGGASPRKLETDSTQLRSELTIPFPGDPHDGEFNALSLVARAFRRATKPLGGNRAKSILLWPEAEREVSIATLVVHWDHAKIKGKYVTVALRADGSRVWSADGIDSKDEMYEADSLRTMLQQHRASKSLLLEISANDGVTDAVKFTLMSTQRDKNLQEELGRAGVCQGAMQHLYRGEVYSEFGLYPEAASEYAQAHNVEPESMLLTMCEERLRQLYSDKPVVTSLMEIQPAKP